MMIMSGETETQYGLTPAGQFYELHKAGKATFGRVTPDPERFLRWLIAAEVDKEIERKRKISLIKIIAKLWTTRHNVDDLRGTFNVDHYNKVLEARRERGIQD